MIRIHGRNGSLRLIVMIEVEDIHVLGDLYLCCRQLLRNRRIWLKSYFIHAQTFLSSIYQHPFSYQKDKQIKYQNISIKPMRLIPLNLIQDIFALYQFDIKMMNQANETIFSNWKDYIQRESEKIINLNLQHKPYDSLKSQDQIGTISQQIIQKLSSTNKNFKYIVNVILLAKGGNGFDLGGMTYYNAEMDGTITVKWESKYLTCIAVVYGVAN